MPVAGAGFREHTAFCRSVAFLSTSPYTRLRSAEDALRMKREKAVDSTLLRSGTLAMAIILVVGELLLKFPSRKSFLDMVIDSTHIGLIPTTGVVIVFH